MVILKLYIYIFSNQTDSKFIKNCSIDIFKIFTGNQFIQSNIDDCDIAMFFIDIPLPLDFNIMLERLWDKKIILIFTGDSIGYFHKQLLNLTNVIIIGSHSTFADYDLYKQPTLYNAYSLYLITKTNNSYHQNLKVLHTEKVKCMIRSYFTLLNNSNNKLLKDRSIDIACLGNITYQNDLLIGCSAYSDKTPIDIVGESRIKGMNIVQELKDKYKVRTGKYPYHEYIDIGKNVKIFISMQGIGETRWPGDLELAQLGCIIIKNCDYKIISCPNIFNHVIYCNYNFDNLKEIIDNILKNIDNYQDIVNKLQSEILNFNEDEHINQISNSILHSYSKYEIDHLKCDNIYIYNEELLNGYSMETNNLIFHLNENIDEKRFNSFGFLPITDYYIYHTYKCFRNKRYQCLINFTCNVDKIRYYDGDKWNIVIPNNKIFIINYENDFNKYIKSRIGFCYEKELKIIEIKQLDYKIHII